MLLNTLFLVYPGERIPLLGVLYVATVLQKNGILTKILDCTKENIMEDNELFNVLIELNPQNICLSVATVYAKKYETLVKNIRKILPNSKIILGGHHATALPQKSFLDIAPDVLVKGEGEPVILDIIQALNKNQKKQLAFLPGILFKDGNKTIETPGVNRVKDLSALPIPDWSLLPPNEYNPNLAWFPLPANKTDQSTTVAYLQTSRGCKYNCPFCASKGLSGQGIRYRSAEHVIEEIKILTEKYQVRRLCIIDDNFVNRKEHAYNICKAIIANGIKIQWILPNGIKIQDIDDELLDVFVKSGLSYAGFGIETLDLSLQEKNRKIIDIDKAITTVNKFKSKNIITDCFLIIGLPGETRQTIENTIWQLQRFSFDHISVTSFMPQPGSEYFDSLPLQENWDEYEFNNITNSYCELSISELKYYRGLLTELFAQNLPVEELNA